MLYNIYIYNSYITVITTKTVFLGKQQNLGKIDFKNHENNETNVYIKPIQFIYPYNQNQNWRSYQVYSESKIEFSADADQRNNNLILSFTMELT